MGRPTFVDFCKFDIKKHDWETIATLCSLSYEMLQEKKTILIIKIFLSILSSSVKKSYG